MWCAHSKSVPLIFKEPINIPMHCIKHEILAGQWHCDWMPRFQSRRFALLWTQQLYFQRRFTLLVIMMVKTIHLANELKKDI